MRTEQQPATPTERLSSEDLAAIRRRYADLGSVREDGAATVGDVAEALGLAPAEVGRHLDRIREDRAHRPAAPARRDQRALLTLAVVLLGGAYAIHRLTIPPTEEEREARLQEALDEQRAHRRRNRPIAYPIPNKLQTGPRPPMGYDVNVKGTLTVTTLGSGERTTDPETAKAALLAALRSAFQAARKFEAKAPQPTKPLPKSPYNPGTGMEPAPGRFFVSFGPDTGWGSPLDTLPAPGAAPEAAERALEERLKAVADGAIDGTLRSQEESLKVEPFRKDGYVMPPAGYSVQFKGWQQTSMGSGPRSFVFPMDEARVARKLEWAVRSAVWKDAIPPDYETPETRSMRAKQPTPAFADVTLDGPLGPVEFKLPLTASPGYPTAADAARAADRILAAKAREAAAQMGRLRRGERRP